MKLTKKHPSIVSMWKRCFHLQVHGSRLALRTRSNSLIIGIHFAASVRGFVLMHSPYRTIIIVTVRCRQLSLESFLSRIASLLCRLGDVMRLVSIWRSGLGRVVSILDTLVGDGCVSEFLSFCHVPWHIFTEFIKSSTISFNYFPMNDVSWFKDFQQTKM